ncbi:hypothetical protein HOY80DRAFT_998781 [Tuber brumale]|nr:hypothetical protein HOY80DRAFT_998781 [Tuber brumale]
MVKVTRVSIEGLEGQMLRMVQQIASLRDNVAGKWGKITASSLGHSVFSQGIIAKYLAYGPPKHISPFELATNSFRPSSARGIATGQIGSKHEVLVGVMVVAKI